MTTVQVWNDGDYKHVEKFRDMTIEIPAHGSIDMDRGDAKLFLGQFYPPSLDGDGNHRPIALSDDGRPLIGKGGFKKLRIVDSLKDLKNLKTQAEKDFEVTCPSCGYLAKNKWELDGHIADLHLDDMEDEDARKEVEKKRRGRPPKGITTDGSQENI